jgi:hypothetical protein
MQRDDIAALAKGMVPFVREVVGEANALPPELMARVKAATELLAEPLPQPVETELIDVAQVEPLRSVRGAVITRSGELALAYSDGSSERLGHVIGPQGERGPTGERGADGIGSKGDDGPPGRDGVSVQSATIRGGELIMTLSDGTVLSPGRVGPAKK